MAKSKDRKKEAKAGKTSQVPEKKKGQTKAEVDGKKTKGGKAVDEIGKSKVRIDKCSPCIISPAAQFQDRTYGKGRRVFVANGDKTSFFCSVCGLKNKSKFVISAKGKENE